MTDFLFSLLGAIGQGAIIVGVLLLMDWARAADEKARRAARGRR